MSNDSNKFQVSNILAAGIVGASLVVSAQIVARRPISPAANSPATLAGEAPAAINGAKPLVAPPLAQESVRKQFRAQVLAAPQLHTYRYNNKLYTLADVKVAQVIYTAKEDAFLIRFEWVWKEGNPHGASWKDATSLSNDGYGHYFGTVSLSSMSERSGQSAEVTIR